MSTVEKVSKLTSRKSQMTMRILRFMAAWQRSERRRARWIQAKRLRILEAICGAQDEEQQQGQQTFLIHKHSFSAGDCRRYCLARRGQAQSKREFHFLAFLREKRLAQEQHHNQEPQRK